MKKERADLGALLGIGPDGGTDKSRAAAKRKLLERCGLDAAVRRERMLEALDKLVLKLKSRDRREWSLMIEGHAEAGGGLFAREEVLGHLLFGSAPPGWHVGLDAAAWALATAEARRLESLTPPRRWTETDIVQAVAGDVAQRLAFGGAEQRQDAIGRLSAVAPDRQPRYEVFIDHDLGSHLDEHLQSNEALAGQFRPKAAA